MTPASPDAIGPIVHFRGADASSVRLAITTGGSVTVAPHLVVDGLGPVDGEPIGAIGGARFWDHGFTLPLEGVGRTVSYTVDGSRFAVGLPARGGALRLAYASCNGGEDEEKAAAWHGGRNALWLQLMARHAADPFHLLVMGGDQIYADALWSLPHLGRWRREKWATRLAASFTPEMAAEAEAFYARRYAEVWAQPEIAHALASLPCLMMWDDHDIFDGYGSHPAELQASPVVQGLFALARRAFALFQLGIDPDRPPDGFADANGAHFGWAGRYGPADLVMPDLRSERTRRQVMGPTGEHVFTQAIAAASQPHLLVISSVPIINADLSGIESAVRPLWRWIDLYQDDLRDQWMSRAHRHQWDRVVDGLIREAETGTHVTVLSGEIHLATRGIASRGAAKVDQLIASGIAHPPPPKALAHLLARSARRSWRRGDVDLSMKPFDPAWPPYVAERNWLEVTAEPNGALDAVLHAEESGSGQYARDA